MAWTVDRKQRRMWSRPLVAAAFFGLGAIAVVVAALVLTRPVSPVPTAIQRQLHFPVFYPSSLVKVDQESFKYDSPSGVLSYIGTLPDGQQATFAEQSTPDPFNDIPDYYSKFLLQMYEYTAFDSLQGTIHLTHPKNTGQVAVMNAKGTLLFIRVEHDEPKETWQQLFNALLIYQS